MLQQQQTNKNWIIEGVALQEWWWALAKELPARATSFPTEVVLVTSQLKATFHTYIASWFWQCFCCSLRLNMNGRGSAGVWREDGVLRIHFFVMLLVWHVFTRLGSRDARPTPRKTGCPTPAREKQALHRPAPEKLIKPAGRDGAKLTVDSNIKILCLFSSCPQIVSYRKKKRDKLYNLALCTAFDYLVCRKTP